MNRFRRIGRRSRRQRTRWLAINPGSRLGLASNTFASDELVLVDRYGTVNTNEFYGQTLLRVILDVSALYTISGTPSTEAGSIIGHAGVLVTADNTLDSATWSPNSPSGDFMERHSYGGQLIYGTSDIPSLDTMPNTTQVMSFDTNVKRRMRENTRLFVAWTHFLTGTAIVGVDYGWTGRVLMTVK